jgi:hypothetical protein
MKGNTNGSDEPLTIEIPKGNYLPVIRGVRQARPAPRSSRRFRLPDRGAPVAQRAIVAILVAVLLSCAAALSAGLVLRRNFRPTVEAF